MTLVVNLRKVEEALKNKLWMFKANQVTNPIQMWVLETTISEKMGFTWQEEDTFGSLIRGFHQQIYIENRGEDIEFVYPQEGDYKLDKNNNPVEEHPPVLDSNGNPVYDTEGNIVFDLNTSSKVRYGKPELFFDKKGAGRITQYIPENLKNSKPAISQFYVELDEWRKEPIGDGSLQPKNVIIFQPDLSQYNSRMPSAWITLMKKTNNVPNTMLNQDLETVPFDSEVLGN